MGDFLRSQPMTLVQFVIPFDVAHSAVNELGKVGVVQFRDLNPEVSAPQRFFVNDVKRIDEMERKLRFFYQQTINFANKYKRNDLLFRFGSYVDSNTDSELLSSGAGSVGHLEGRFEDLENRLNELTHGEEGLRRMLSDTVEKRNVLEIVDRDMQAANHQGFGGAGSLSTVIGSIDRARVGIFERIIWRLTRGNMYLKVADMDENIPVPDSTEFEEKSAFMILTQGSHIQEKIKKLGEAFGATFYDCPDSHSEFQREIRELLNKETDLGLVLGENAKGSEREYLDIADNYDAWRVWILKEKSIFHTLNLFRYNLSAKTFIAEGWCPDDELEKVTYATQMATQRSGSAFPVVFKAVPTTKETPPTYFRTNKFTQAHQEIVDAYGVAQYQEINPTVFSIITFPFLFGVMFGDVGHGIMMLLFVLFLIAREKAFMKEGLNEMVQTCFDGRYIIVLMSLFSIYCGFMYNECFSVPMAFNGFPASSQYDLTPGQTHMTLNDEGYRYPFGVDPAWKGAENELYYYNSLKMKMSVLMGVIQMMLGIILSGLNARFAKKPYDFWFQFVPQAVFMMSIFGYLCLLILAKWLMTWDDVIEDTNKAVPSLLSTLVNMFLSPTSLSGDGASEEIYGAQEGIQIFLLVIALLCVPLMLFPKPFLLRRDHMERKGYGHLIEEGGEEDGEGGFERFEEDHVVEEFEFQEVMIHQIIHTIEFVLGAISNTASYLRLWALSLAHSELSTVFWEKILVGALEMHSIPSMVIGFAVWGVLNFAVLMVMESLSAFLHALRLHWVEFQNKFYGGDGQKFSPFSFESVIMGGGE